MPSVSFRSVEDSKLVTSYNDLKVYKPDLPRGWHYLGPIATTSNDSPIGLIVRALEASALADVICWESVAITPSFSAWRGIAPEGYIVIGHFFAAHDRPPAADETTSIKAIRKGLIQEATADYLIWRDTATNVTLQRDSDDSGISSKAFISQQGHPQNHVIGLLSKSKAEEMTTEAEQQLFSLLQVLLRTQEDLTDAFLPQLLEDAFKNVMASKGQGAIRDALIMLTRLEKMLPDHMIHPLNDKLVSMFYERMPHPPKAMAGVNWRSEDGSSDLGKAGMPYARSVPKTKIQFDDVKAEDVFNDLLKRQDNDDPPNPDGISSLLFAFGTLVIHTVFYTDFLSPLGKDNAVNKASSYVDLSILYGNNKAEVDEMRDAAVGRGLLCPDCFSDSRSLILPPSAAALLILFNRNHNYIAESLLKENENQRWSDPPPKDKYLRERQDEEIFQTARLINCIHFANVVITDYVGGIMGVPGNGGGWPANAEPFDEIELDGHQVSRGDGNLVSIEFNLIYRWHSTLSKPDVKWVTDIISEPRDPKNWEKVAQLAVKPQYRTFANLKRGKDGTFADDDLARLVHDAIEAPAGLFRAQGSPGILNFVDIRGITQARNWNVCTFNEFREWLGLPRYTSFTQWNANEKIATAAEKLYGNIDRLELYPGIHAEGHASDGLGSQYSPLRVHTMRNAILFDAISLIRGDKFFTTDFTPENLTKWGWNDVQRQYPSKAFGGHLNKLLFRLLPNYFPKNSIYSWFPMSVPEFMKNNKKLPPGSWDFTRPSSQAPAA